MAKRFIFMIVCSFLAVRVGAQVGVKTNLLGWSTASINGGVEVGVADRSSVQLMASINPFTMGDNKRWKHWLVQPEYRYWFCESFAGHFVAIHALAGEFNVGRLKNSIRFLGSDFSGLSDKRYQGWGAGAGIAYGYSWILGRHWNLEAEIGLGWVYTRYDVYPCANCGTRLAQGKTHNYVGPTKAAVNLVYAF